MKKTFFTFSVGVAALCVLTIIFLATGLWKKFFNPAEEQYRVRVVTPREGVLFTDSLEEQQLANQHLDTKVPMEDGEAVIAVLNQAVEGELAAEDQFVVYRYTGGAARQVHLTFINYDEQNRRFRRVWNLPTAATKPETVSIASLDLIGDRNNCIVVSGMNDQNDHTMTIFRRNPRAPNQPFSIIAEIQIDGSIVIQETLRSLAYQQGVANGAPFNIAAYGHDSASSNFLDQIETIYSFNQTSGLYERARVSRIPGSQIEQRRLREILSGSPGVFENFIQDLWYYVSPQGTLDLRQYLFFDPQNKEIIFYSEDTQQVFFWENSLPTRNGIYIRSQNISISTLRRFIDIELISLDSIRLRVLEDVRLRISATASWDGTYRRATSSSVQETPPAIRPAINASFDSSLGKFQFFDTGEYTLNNRRGRYIFFKADGNDVLELRMTDGAETISGADRMIYRVENVGSNMILSRVRLGIGGIQDMMEIPITLTLAE